MTTVVFRIEGAGEKRIEAACGSNLLEVARQADVAIDTPCSGAGTCGKCRVQVLEGSLEGGQDWRKPQEDFDQGWRLACQAAVEDQDLVVFVPADARAYAHGIATADFSTPEEMARYQQELEALFARELEMGVPQQGVGLAVDIGTTTVAAVLLDLQTGAVLAKASAGNDQIRYGADVINRIVNQKKPGGVELLQDAVRANTLIPLIEQLCAQANIESVSISRAVIAGNTTMEHLLLGEDGDSIRMEPFEPAFLERQGDTAQSVGLPLAPDAPVIFAPNVGSYVGGDITAGTLTTGLWQSDQVSFFIDLGTNGEMVYGNAEYMLCCACSAGPAFEGGDISCGMRATKGAIQACTIDPDTMEPTLEIIGDGAPKGLCGSGIIDTVAELYQAGIVSPKGRFNRQGPRVRQQDFGGAEYVLAFKGELGAEKDITINETDLDCFIRAKGSIYSAYCSILKAVGAQSHEVDRVFIAGGIGAGINLKNAISIGMLPNIPLEKYHYIGNGSLAGACGMLVSTQAEEKVFELGRSMTYLELSIEPGYMEEFIAACFLPHTDRSLFE